jgi:glycosyltransferase involved in cell wall biosynthesis
MIFDNASCEEVREYLLNTHRIGKIQYLILSEKNVGKGGAWNIIFQSAPGDIIAYADSDVQFLQGWLENSLEVLSNFPNVGMVTARPLRTPQEFYTSTLEWARAEKDATCEPGQFIDWEHFKEHTDSLGMSEKEAEESFRTMHEWRIQYKGITCYAGAAHFQFLGNKSVFSSVVPMDMDRPMGQVRGLDIRLNDQGFLRLSTDQSLVKHIGNRLSPDSADLIQTTTSLKTSRRRIFNSPFIRRPLLFLYHKIFQMYYDNKP